MESFDDVRDEVISKFRYFDNFPIPGQEFCDIMPLMKEPKLIKTVCDKIVNFYRGKIDAVAALEARGFLLGPSIALGLEVPFVAIRKPNKLPGPVHEVSYQKEYGPDKFTIQVDAFEPKQRVLIFDDILATGGSLESAVKLVEKTGAKFEAAFVLVELVSLKGRDRVDREKVEALWRYM